MFTDTKLNAPIVVPDSPPPPSSPPKSAYLPPEMMPSAPGSHFLPTILPEETTSMNPIIDLFAFPKHVNSSYMPTELDAIKDSINSNHRYENEPESETTDTSSKDLFNFPPNVDSKYLPPEMKNKLPINSYLPPPSGDEDDENSKNAQDETEPYSPPTDIFNFPPNVDSKYLPPKPFTKPKTQENSYLPPPSGDETEDTKEKIEPYSPPTNFFNFPPNINSKYLPPWPFTKTKLPINSYLPSPSGDQSDDTEVLEPPKDNTKPYAPPTDLFNFPPNVDTKYLPPKPFNGNKLPINSYLPPPSGDDNEAPPKVEPVATLPEITAKNKQPAEGTEPYTLPKKLLNFPPNIESNYLPPEMITNNKPPISSYLPPPSGDQPENTQPYVPPSKPFNFPPNLDSTYLPPKVNSPKILNNSYHAPASGSETDLSQPIPYMYNPPQNLNNFPPNIQSSYLPPPEMKQLMASVNSYLPPPSGSVSGFSVGSKQNFPGPMAPPQMAPYSYLPPQMSQPPPPPMNTAPSGPPMGMMPPSAMDHDHHHHDHDHHHDHTAPDFAKWQSYPDIIYDYDHHHHHHHEPPPPPETTTVEAPEEPRVKKYSYYYLGRKLWYIPLYFTLWFCLYVAALIIRSIGRHKVN